MEPRPPDLTLASALAYASPSRPFPPSSLLTPREIGSACGPRVYLRCSTSRAKYYASVLLCDHPDGGAPLREGEGIVATSVFTRWHTPSDLLHARYARRVRVYRSRYIRRLRRRVDEVRPITNRMENSCTALLPQFVAVTQCYLEIPLLKYLELRRLRKAIKYYVRKASD